MSDLAAMVHTCPSAQTKLGPALLRTYVSVDVVEGLDVDRDTFDKFSARSVLCCICVCVCACMRACVCVSVCVYICLSLSCRHVHTCLPTHSDAHAHVPTLVFSSIKIFKFKFSLFSL